jgi:hypothetical protein
MIPDAYNTTGEGELARDRGGIVELAVSWQIGGRGARVNLSLAGVISLEGKNS